MAEGGEHDSAQGARIEGKIDVVRTLLESSQRINDERHARTSADVDDLRTRQHRFGNELMVAQAEIGALSGIPVRVDRLEDADKVREGERRGVTNTLKIAWLLGGSGATALVLAIARKADLL